MGQTYIFLLTLSIVRWPEWRNKKV